MPRFAGFSISMAAITAMLIIPQGGLMAEDRMQPLVRMAELDIDPARLDAYTALLKEEIEASVRLEKGVLTLNAVAVKGQPSQIRILEIYADQAAYETHLKSPHFLKYKTGTADMVRSLRLVETEPVMLCTKAGGGRSASCF